MKKSTKLFIILLIVGTVGLAAMLGATIGTGMMYSRETSQTYVFDAAPDAVSLETVQAQVTLVPSEECRVEAYVKAWRPDEIDMSDVLDVSMEDGDLTIKEKPFAADFLGFFPQPYEMKLTIYTPQPVLDALEGELK